MVEIFVCFLVVCDLLGWCRFGCSLCDFSVICVCEYFFDCV